MKTRWSGVVYSAVYDIFRIWYIQNGIRWESISIWNINFQKYKKIHDF